MHDVGICMVYVWYIYRLSVYTSKYIYIYIYIYIIYNMYSVHMWLTFAINLSWNREQHDDKQRHSDGCFHDRPLSRVCREKSSVNIFLAQNSYAITSVIEQNLPPVLSLL